jgi:hypothetical protein
MLACMPFVFLSDSSRKSGFLIEAEVHVMVREYAVSVSRMLIVALLVLGTASLGPAYGGAAGGDPGAAADDDIFCRQIENRVFVPDVQPGALGGTCDPVKTVGHFTLRFRGVDYDYERNESFWLYAVEWDGEPPPLNDLVIGLGECIVRADIIGACPGGYRVEFDVGTGIYGIKWDVLPAIADLHISILVKGIYDVGEVPFAIKADETIMSDTICGLICEETCELEITCPPDMTVDCVEPTDPDYTGEPSVEGTCPPFEVSYEDVTLSAECPALYMIERTWTATDVSGLVDECVQVITVLDTTPPVITCAADERVPCGQEVIFTEPGVTDDCDDDPVATVVSTEVVPGPEEGEYTHTRCWVGVDHCGNTSEPCCQSIIVEACPECRYCTFTQCSWAKCCPCWERCNPMSKHIGCIRDRYFDQVFPNGVTIGDPCGPGTYGATWTSACTVRRFLPAFGWPGVLKQNLTDPKWTRAGSLAGELLALRLNREFSCEGIFELVGLADEVCCLGDYVIPCYCGKFAGLTVDEFLVIADQAIAGNTEVLAPYGASLWNVTWTAACINLRWIGCGCGCGCGSDKDDQDDTIVDEAAGGLLAAGSGDASARAIPTELQVNSHPNPLSQATTITLALPTDSRVTLEIYDIQGRMVTRLLSGAKSAGYHEVLWEGKDDYGNAVMPGVYFCRVHTETGGPVFEKMIKF